MPVFGACSALHRGVQSWALHHAEPASWSSHIQFIGDDAPYDASVPVEIALDPRRPVMLAFEMNGEPVPREHGGRFQGCGLHLHARNNPLWLAWNV